MLQGLRVRSPRCVLRACCKVCGFARHVVFCVHAATSAGSLATLCSACMLLRLRVRSRRFVSACMLLRLRVRSRRFVSACMLLRLRVRSRRFVSARMLLRLRVRSRLFFLPAGCKVRGFARDFHHVGGLACDVHSVKTFVFRCCHWHKSGK